MNSFETTGGARIGNAKATWPFATLKVDKNKLELNASIIGNLIFRPQDIISITPYSSFISSGLKINHRVSNYKSEVIFWALGDEPTSLINQIKQTGFFENINSSSIEDNQLIIDRQKSGSFPIKKTVAIFFAVIWNTLLFYDFVCFITSGGKGSPLGNGAIIAFGTILLTSTLLIISKDFCRIVLKEGRTVKDVNRFLYMLMFISVFVLTIIWTLKRNL